MSATRFDPFDNFKFRVAFDGKPVPGVSKVSALSRITDVVEYREGGENNSSSKLGGLSHFPAIVLERGLSVDTTFEDWAALVLPFPTGSSSGNFRKDVDLEIKDESGKGVLTYHILGYWPSEYQPFAGLDAKSDGIAVEMIRLENEGWKAIRN